MFVGVSFLSCKENCSFFFFSKVGIGMDDGQVKNATRETRRSTRVLYGASVCVCVCVRGGYRLDCKKGIPSSLLFLVVRFFVPSKNLS